MSAQLKSHWLSVSDYLAFEESSEIKHEYINGEIYAMAGTSVRHNRIAGNLYTRLLERLRGSPCEVFFADVKLHLQQLRQDIFYYPDVMVCCDPQDREKYYRTRPCLVVEVLSGGTARVDQREKLFAYTRLDSLQGYLILDQDRISATLHWREGSEWRLTEFNDSAAELTLPCVNLTIRLEELYEGTGLPEPALMVVSS